MAIPKIREEDGVAIKTYERGFPVGRMDVSDKHLKLLQLKPSGDVRLAIPSHFQTALHEGVIESIRYSDCIQGYNAMRATGSMQKLRMLQCDFLLVDKGAAQ